MSRCDCNTFVNMITMVNIIKINLCNQPSMTTISFIINIVLPEGPVHLINQFFVNKWRPAVMVVNIFDVVNNKHLFQELV